ncbi:helix-turn-helix transcriptional regulator [Nocardioides sp. zg-ZUI104]|uniref:helix-turn-helix domain-containing protein n=1 Tax=Nocardioides faecalis TaxID=2803858 RepID=UPI001BCFB71C|nr:helix-turn-helix transcriptional regulator [Nocardioides faecalis]MBS4753244.1 helix-turn-helix transcriptional regulator [Nocardioides faecalis]
MGIDKHLVMAVSAEALGLAIKRLRERPDRKITQQELGDAAGYATGAAVSISRIEAGRSRPKAERLERIADGLGVTVEELVEVASEVEETVFMSHDSASTDTSGESLSFKERLLRVQQVVSERAETATAAAERFNRAVDRAREGFFDPFCATGGEIEGAEVVEPPASADNLDDSDAATEALYRLQHSSSVVAGALRGGVAGAALGSASAYGAFTAAAAFGTASTGTAIGSLSGVAATNATMAFLGGGSLAAGGAGMAGGTMLLMGIVATPIAALAAGGAFYMVRRNRKKQAELEVTLEEAESEIAESQPGFDAMIDLMGQAADILDDIAVHGSRAYQRWATSLPPRPTQWPAMSEPQQDRYLDLIQVAGAQLLISTASMRFTLLMSARGDDLEALVRACEEQLGESRRVVDARI